MNADENVIGRAASPTATQTHSMGGSYAAQVHPAMRVVDSDGNVVGTVKAVDGDEIRLVGTSDGDPHRFVPLSLVEGIDGDRVLMRGRGDNAFGVAAST